MTAIELTELLEDTGIRPVEVADWFGLEPSTITRYTRGRTPIPDELAAKIVRRIAETTGPRNEAAQAALRRYSMLVAAL